MKSKKNIIVTGTSRGIGFELVQELAKDGHNILALSRDDKPLKTLNNDKISAFSFDISVETDFEKVGDFINKKWGHVDILINNAGALVNKPFEKTSIEEFKKIYDVNVFGVARLIQCVLPFMKKGAHVLNISSMGGVQGSAKFAGLSAYSSSKGALAILSELLAEEYNDKGISFNTLALGAVQTEMLEEAFPGYEAPVSANEMANYIKNFALTGNQFYNGKVLPVSASTP
ncbi:SDR family NAD(P)-dependent oxidoreductase [Flavimarina sp. Hel_I_48]|uniref:SDR family NAD(P)-dependent oxidoreductase n=1 Tax=Flavimarina sp. Hel_I_48 TaxID=1392488 RepID=UPI0004DF4EB7|nr:SDR family oxidoreductase [Flavimarina sp. Hel_I_48]